MNDNELGTPDMQATCYIEGKVLAPYGVLGHLSIECERLDDTMAHAMTTFQSALLAPAAT